MLGQSESIYDTVEPKIDLTDHRLRIYRARIGISYVTRDKEAFFHYAEINLKAEEEIFARTNQVSTNLAAAYHHMGIAYNLNSLAGEAIPYLEDSTKTRRLLPGFKEDWLFTPLYQLGLSYFMLGNLEKSAQLLQKAIQDRVDAFGENDRGAGRFVPLLLYHFDDTNNLRIGALYYVLGDVKNSQGKYAEALELHIKAFDHLSETAGRRATSTIHSKYKVAAHYMRLHAYATAR